MSYCDYGNSMRFDGDIIITDPCYVVKNNRASMEDYPSFWDYLSKATWIVDEKGQKRYHYPKPEEYPDCRIAERKDFQDGKIGDIEFRLEVELANYPRKVSDTLKAEVEKWHEAKNNWHEKNKDDWEICDYGANMEALGITHYLCASTKYGDWSCHTYTDTPEHTVLGQFCADAGLVGVFLLDEVKKYNPDYAGIEKSPHAVTLIKDFHGEISINLIEEEFCVNEEERFNEDWFPEYETEEVVSVIGKGNIDFFTCQTGL